MKRPAIERYQNVLFILGAVCVGIVAPSFESYTAPLITPLVIFLVFTSLQGLQPGEIDFSSYAILVALSLGISYVLLPVGGIHLVEFMLADSAIVGFAIALSVPTTAGSAIVWTRLARGDVQLATTISLVSLTVAPVATPIVLTQLLGSQIAVPIGTLLFDLLIIVGGGALFALCIPATLFSTRTLDRGSTLAILLLIYTSVASIDVTAIAGWHLLRIGGVSILLVGLGLCLSILFERSFNISRHQTFPLFFASSLKNIGIALLIALAFDDSLVVLSIIVYYIIQQLSGAAIADATVS
ncbi:bile acid:sodium symporter family protein [Halalkalicoccus subterraneus]|uniref:bile acid:sodium symporter family protein n=1 Tax=Halalkalicoccus subterraneus TaxID=2675002 RepID=UPI000EFD296F|nr:bile acid:sodium symporter [Halalkalicoccus subterraneus]